MNYYQEQIKSKFDALFPDFKDNEVMFTSFSQGYVIGYTEQSQIIKDLEKTLYGGSTQ
jgi:hypothetical protein